MAQLAAKTSGKVIYTAKTHTTGGRDNGAARSSDGQVDVRLSTPGTSHPSTNPEQLFAAGWSACFEAGWRSGLFVALYARGVRTENFVSFVSRFGSDVVVLAAALAQAGKASVACATTMRDVLGARSSDGSVHLQPLRAARRRLEPVLAHSARAITLAHRAPLINTTPHGATRMAVVATVDSTRSHAGTPVRDGLRLINA